MQLRDKWGYPVEMVKGKHMANLIRLLARTNLKQTLKRINY